MLQRVNIGVGAGVVGFLGLVRRRKRLRSLRKRKRERERRPRRRLSRPRRLRSECKMISKKS
jgi:hypothetical protein